MVPIESFEGYIVCFQAWPELVTARDHFITELGWDRKQFDAIRGNEWFCAEVSIWKDGKKLANDYLGCCSYVTEAEFYQEHRPYYFADMVHECLLDVGELGLAQKWRDDPRNNVRER